MAEELHHPESTSEKLSFIPGIAFFAAALAVNVIGKAMAESAMDSAYIPGSFLNAGLDIQRAARIQGTTDILVYALCLIGSILIIRAAISRMRRSHMD